MEYEKAFSLISEPIERFAKQNNLLIEKYRWDAPSWMLCFKRKIGGIGYIFVNYLNNFQVKQRNDQNVKFEVVISWAVDDYDSETRHAVRKEIGKIDYDGNLSKVTNLLNQALDIFKGLRHKDLEKQLSGMNWKNYWSTKEIFMQSINYPEIDI